MSAPPHLPGAPDLDAACMAAHGRSWTELKQPLSPHHGQVWRDIGLCYLGLGLGTGVIVGVQLMLGTGVALVLLPIGVALTGFWMASLVRFMHEGGHRMLHPNPQWNDRLCNAFVCAWVLDEVANNRATHWQHHLHLGGHGDTEITYFRAPTNRFLLRTLTALYVFEIIGRRILGGQAETPRSSGRILFSLVRSAAYHAAVLGFLLWMGGWVGALCWALAMGTTYPFFDVLRQILEHRREDIGPEIDLSQEVHGPHNRLFGKGAWSRWFGNAGFHNHLLHHWDPTVSYTRLDEMEEILLQTDLAPQIEAARTTYSGVWRELRVAARA